MALQFPSRGLVVFPQFFGVVVRIGNVVVENMIRDAAIDAFEETFHCAIVLRRFLEQCTSHGWCRLRRLNLISLGPSYYFLFSSDADSSAVPARLAFSAEEEKPHECCDENSGDCADSNAGYGSGREATFFRSTGWATFRY